MSVLTTIEAKIGHLEGEAKAAFEAALEAFKAELVRLGIEHAVTPADPAPSATVTGPDIHTNPTPDVGSGSQPGQK